jgi:ABC-2 type transport system ATP-binding protein
MATAPVISARDVSKRFDDGPVIRNLDFEVQPGTVVGVIGPSGCGKTTTVRLLTGLYRPTTGTVQVMGRTAHELSRRDRRAIGYLPQLPPLFPELSLWENLNFLASIHGVGFGRRARLRRLLEWVELADDRHKRVSEASGGMRRRLALAGTFVHDPRLIFLDEPTAGIDPILRTKFWEHFRDLRDAGRTIIVTTQYVGEAAHCDVVALIVDGEMPVLDTPEHLLRRAYGGDVIDVVTVTPVTDTLVSELTDQPFVRGRPERTGYQSLLVVVDDARSTLPHLRDFLRARRVSVREIGERAVDYDEAFVRVVEEHRARNGKRETAA